MKQRVVAVFLSILMCVSVLAGCGSKVEEASVEPAVDEVAQEESSENEEADAFNAIGDVDVDKGLFNVTLTIPKDIIGDKTQEELDESVQEHGYKSATLNDDGSVTYVMTKAQHEELLSGIRESIDKSLDEMVGSEDYPNITDVSANDDYTSFTVTTKSTELDLAESFTVMAFYMYGGMYGIFAGEEVDNIHVDFVNADSGEVIESSDSKDMASDSE